MLPVMFEAATDEAVMLPVIWADVIEVICAAVMLPVMVLAATDAI